MSIEIEHIDDLFYSVVVKPSKYRQTEWSSDRPLTRRQVIDRLVEIGFHLQDIADALDVADRSAGK
jgi:hypothetical protein